MVPEFDSKRCSIYKISLTVYDQKTENEYLGDDLLNLARGFELSPYIKGQPRQFIRTN